MSNSVITGPKVPPTTTQYGVCLLPTDLIAAPVDLARAAEQRELDAMFFAEGSHVPVKHTNNAYTSSAVVQPFARMYDSITALAACAAVTSKITLGTGVCLLTERDPIITAKAIASLDQISNGRVIFGVAGGFIREAIENHGSSFKDRWAIVRERALAIQTIWTNEVAEYHGEFVDFGPLWSYPKPRQVGGPPLYIGSNHGKIPDRVVDYADGWMPIYERYAGDPVEDLRRACATKNRDFAELTIYLFGVPLDEKIIEDFTKRGVHGFIFLIPSESDQVMSELDKVAALVERLRNNGSS
ncbi:MAG: TIGR03619 family F420-dependent LLM class oxidoreductase [Proteobacteria bacterium]|nr:TIGR03619 family F420-dependent LLM class oxidoreductase [Pseudomonadota bacterium]